MPLENTVIGQNITPSVVVIEEDTPWFMTYQEVVLDYATNILTALAILFIGLYLVRAICRLLNHLFLKKGLESTVASFISTITRYILLSIVFIAALSQIGVQTASFIAIIGAAGLTIGLALKGYLSDFASSILLITLRPFKKGDYIEVAGAAGTVDSIRSFNTMLTTIDNKYIFVPNSSLINNSLVNYSRKETRRVDLVVRVSYKADLMKVKQILEGVVLANKNILPSPAFQIAVAELSASSVNIVVRPWVKSADYWDVNFALTESIKNAFQEEGIEIPYRQLALHRK